MNVASKDEFAATEYESASEEICPVSFSYLEFAPYRDRGFEVNLIVNWILTHRVLSSTQDVYQAEVAVDFDPKFHTARLSTFAEHGIAPCAPSSSQQKFRFDQSTCGSQYPGSCALELLPN
eukprot:3938366-Rhodomonas_salina.3